MEWVARCLGFPSEKPRGAEALSPGEIQPKPGSASVEPACLTHAPYRTRVGRCLGALSVGATGAQAHRQLSLFGKAAHLFPLMAVGNDSAIRLRRWWPQTRGGAAQAAQRCPTSLYWGGSCSGSRPPPRG